MSAAIDFADLARRAHLNSMAVQKRTRAAVLRAEVRFSEFLTKQARRSGSMTREGSWLELMDALISVTGADMGDLQVFDPRANGLRIIAQRGFDTAFLKFFKIVRPGEAACGTALATRRPVIVEDVLTHPIFEVNGSRELLVEGAACRSVFSVPIIDPTGSVLGVFSAHRHRPFHPSDRLLRSLGALAHGVAARLARRPFLETRPVANGNGTRPIVSNGARRIAS